MNQKIEVGDAIVAGFRLIGREPLAFAVWCGVYFAVSALSMLITWGDTSAYYDAIAAGADATDPAIQAAAFGPAQWLSMLVGFGLILTVYTAVLRSVLHPDDRRFSYLRLGMRELWVVLSAILATLLWIVGYLVFALVIGIGLGSIGAAAGGGSGAVAIILMLVLIPVSIWAYVWMTLRLSMATVMSFAENRLRVLASWRFTKGHALAMFLVSLVLTLGALVVFGAVFGVLTGLAASTSGPAAFQKMLSQMAQMSMVARLAFAAVISVLYVAFLVIFMTPWAEMYRQLRPGSVAETFD